MSNSSISSQFHLLHNQGPFFKTCTRITSDGNRILLQYSSIRFYFFKKNNTYFFSVINYNTYSQNIIFSIANKKRKGVHYRVYIIIFSYYLSIALNTTVVDRAFAKDILELPSRLLRGT